MKLLIKNATIADPSCQTQEELDMVIENGTISHVGKHIKEEAETIIDAKGKVIMPGLVDMHVHLREPGREDKETVVTGTAAALKGGVTSLLAMPNTEPAIDTKEHVRLLKGIIGRSAGAQVYVTGAITKGRQGKELADFAAMREEGIVALSDDGSSVDNEELMRNALLLARENKLPVICHCEEKALANSGVVNLGLVSTKLGLRGIPCEAEYKRVERDIRFAEEAGCRIHIAHVSCEQSLEIIARAKKRGARVTAETAPHYFALTEDAVCGYDTNKKMNPPLRSKKDREAICQALRDGTIDVIASDHAPHTESEKEVEFDFAEFGVIGLETLLAVSITELLHTKTLSLPELINKLSCNPSEILGLRKASLKKGCQADLIIVDLHKEWQVTKDILTSKSKNSAFLGRRLRGVVEYAILAERIVYKTRH
ncbi:MAG: dihydroorotase [Candidatus Omnitrophota bacterium]|jgi:dihydroorotase|nr:MAG: dihydroorotase [Candidatus Omnitrophota bacterium]